MANKHPVRLLAQSNQAEAQEIPLHFQQTHVSALKTWRNRVGNRHFWRSMSDVVEDYRHQARDLLETAGLREEDRATLAQVNHIEIAFHAFDSHLWQFPWEFVLFHALSSKTAAAVPIITRRIVSNKKAAATLGDKLRMLLVDATPNVNSRKAERLGLQQQLKNALQRHDAAAYCRLVEPPTSKNLAALLQENWDILHLRGIDLSKAATRGLIHQPSHPDNRALWMPLNGVLDSQTLAKYMGSRQLKLLTCDVAYGATTFVSALTQKPHVVGAMLGFFDTIDEVVSASFFPAFYAQLEQGDLLTAFRAAFQHIRNRPESLMGVGIVLCTSYSLLHKHTQAEEPESAAASDQLASDEGHSSGGGPAPGRPAPGRPAPGHTTPRRAPKKQPQLTRRRKGHLAAKGLDLSDELDPGALSHLTWPFKGTPLPSSDEALFGFDESQSSGDGHAAHFQFNITPLPELNYSLLHNSSQIFSNFDIIPLTDQTQHHLRVTVALETGGSRPLSFQRLWMLDSPVDLSEDIHLPLFSRDLQSLRESVKTTLQVCVASAEGDAVYYDQTHKVELLPINAWKDTPTDRKWLVSFVTPGDEVIPKLLGQAQGYLNVLDDLASSGFDGYQRIDMQGQIDRQAVDHQVQALWWTLIQEHRLAYINPPTNFGQAVQRLRLPTDVIAQGRGTCLDLALLLCAFLEFIDIYPVIFLLEGHAFPGYWRSMQEADQFWANFAVARSDRETGGENEQNDYYNPDLNQVLNLIGAGQLIPIESVLLTERCGFWRAVEEGVKNLTHGGVYEAMLDVRKYRETMDIQPLPIKRGDF